MNQILVCMNLQATYSMPGIPTIIYKIEGESSGYTVHWDFKMVLILIASVNNENETMKVKE